MKPTKHAETNNERLYQESRSRVDDHAVPVEVVLGQAKRDVAHAPIIKVDGVPLIVSHLGPGEARVTLVLTANLDDTIVLKEAQRERVVELVVLKTIQSDETRFDLKLRSVPK